jgi:hypothetical protein
LQIAKFGYVEVDLLPVTGDPEENCFRIARRGMRGYTGSRFWSYEGNYGAQYV